MSGLLRVELTRLRWRRAVVLLLLACAVVPALIGAVVAWDTRPVTDAEVADIRATATSEIEDCVQHPRRYGVRPAVAEERCDELVVGWQTGRRDLSLAQERGGSGIGVVAVLTVLLMLAGTTYAGHDWNSGSVSNQLLFRPRRGRVWVAKALAVGLVAAVTAAVVSTAYWLGLWGLMRSRGLPVADGSLGESLALGLRGAAFATAAALGCYALTMLLRSTVATLGVLLALGFASLLLLDPIGVPEPWQPLTNAQAVVQDGAKYWVDVPPACYDGRYTDEPVEGSPCDSERVLPLWRGAAYCGAALVLVGAASVLSFRRRDVP